MLVINGPYSDAGHEEKGHPERPERLAAAMAAVDDLHLGSDLVVAPSYAASRAELVRVHNGNYLDELGAFCYSGGGNIDQDTYATMDSWTIAQYAAGAGLKVIEELRRLDDGVGFIAARPPGHHALPDRAMGFCLLNNVAIAAAELLSHGERVLIVDWDVHHGNGTEHAFYENPTVLTISLHQDNLYPADSGKVEDTGVGAGQGCNLNIPLPPGSGNGAYEAAMERVVVPAIRTFRPEIILVACGFDASMLDPFAIMMLDSHGFARMTRIVLDLAAEICDGRLAMIHEGGYSSAYVPFCGAAAIEELLGSAARIEDPFIEAFRQMAYTELQPQQDEAIRRAEANLALVPA